MIATCVQVSDEMVALIGTCDRAIADWPADPITFRFELGAHPALHCRAGTPGAGADMILVVARAACRRVFGQEGTDADFHLPQELRTIALAIQACVLTGVAGETYRQAKAIELLCETMRLVGAQALVPMGADSVLSMADSRRLIAARRLIDEHWQEKLTLDRIARTCGLNRVKLTKGFREMFDTTVAGAIAERRLEEARRLLRTTERPIATVGYQSGYLNNASFARAFARRFGVTPSDYRAMRMAA